MIMTEKSLTQDREEKLRMKNQVLAMTLYHNILNSRIEAWGTE